MAELPTKSGVRGVSEIQEAVERFSALKQELYTKYPEAHEEAKALASSIVDPAIADAETVWSVLWPKPLYSGKQVEVSKTWYEQLKPSMSGVWKQMHYDYGPYEIRKDTAPCSSGKMNVSSFVPIGPEVMALKLRANAPPKSYYGMVGAAMALNELIKTSDRPFAHLPSEITADTIRNVQANFGYGWGHITVMHFLTDMGLCCKPDRHLLNTMKALGLYSKDPQKSPTLLQAVKVFRLAKEILIQIEGEVTPRGLRELDKNLMDISYYELITPLPKKPRRSKGQDVGGQKV